MSSQQPTPSATTTVTTAVTTSKQTTFTPTTSPPPPVSHNNEAKPTTLTKSHSAPCAPTDYADAGNNWAAFSDPFLSPIIRSSRRIDEEAWGIGPPVPIPMYHTHFTVVDSMPQSGGKTHYLLESNRGLLFHGHCATSTWDKLLAPKTEDRDDMEEEGSQFAQLEGMASVDASWLYTTLAEGAMTRFQGDVPSAAVFMKKQPFLARSKYRSDHYARCAQQEIERCERIAASPHRHLARYLGVETKRVCGVERACRIAYKRYSMDLYEFVKTKQLLRLKHVDVVMDGVRDGVRHLHGLGLVHCDVRPPNVFVSVAEERDEEGDVVLEEVVMGDFDASVETGKEVRLKRACGEWWPERVGWGDKAEIEIDEWAVEKLARWLMEDGLGIWEFGGEGGDGGGWVDNGESGWGKTAGGWGETADGLDGYFCDGMEESGRDEEVDKLAEYLLENLPGVL